MEEATSGLTLSGEVMTHAKRYHEVREQKRALEAQITDLDAERDQIADILKKKMEELQLQKFNLKGIGTFYLQATFYPKIIGDPVKVIEWLDANGSGSIAPRTINKPAFKELYQEHTEKDMPLPPADLVEAATDVGLRLRGTK